MTRPTLITPFRHRSGRRRSAEAGLVSLVGAGTSSDQLTLGAVKALKEADVVLYDALVADDVTAFMSRGATAIYTGKRCGQHALTQAQINALLVSYGQQGLNVVRLKAGDPFIFGRGSEEVEALRAAGIGYRVLPGVSALNGVAANFALPLTTRGKGAEFRAIQGHRLPDDESYWQDLARYSGTIVIFMGSEKWQTIVGRLLSAGKAPSTPYAVIETSSDGTQHVHRGVLLTADSSPFRRRHGGPAIIYIGENVSLMDSQLPDSSRSRNDKSRAAGRV